MNIPFVCIIDALDDERVIDYKTAKYHTKKDDTNIPMWSSMTVYDEYELQAWMYMLGTGRQIAEFVEVLKDQYKKYKAEEHHQVFTFVWSDDRHEKMQQKYNPVIASIVADYQKYDKVLHLVKS